MLNLMGKLPPLKTAPEPIRILGPDGKPLSDGGELSVSPAHFFSSIWNSISQVYSYRYDEAMKDNTQQAEAMLRDLSITGPLGERYREVMQLPWALIPEDVEDPEQEEVCAELTKVVKRTPRLSVLIYELEEMVWFGRSASQWVTKKDLIGGEQRTVCADHSIIHGDSVQFLWDGTPVVYVRSELAASYIQQGATVLDGKPNGMEIPGLDRGSKPIDLSDIKGEHPEVAWGERAPMLVLDRHWRQQFMVSRYLPLPANYFNAEQAGGIHGVGIRSQIYWAWWMKWELLGWAMNFMRKVGSLGLLVFPYLDGNAKSKEEAEANAKNVSNRSALTVPVPPNSNPDSLSPFVIAPAQSGIEMLIRLIDEYFDWRIERLIIGQSASSSSETSGMGTHDTDAQQTTKGRIIRCDAELLGETLTTDFIAHLQAWNFPGSEKKFKVRWEFTAPDPMAKDKMEAIERAAKLVTVRADDVREAAGLRKPKADDETVGGAQPLPGEDGAGTPTGLDPLGKVAPMDGGGPPLGKRPNPFEKKETDNAAHSGNGLAHAKP